MEKYRCKHLSFVLWTILLINGNVEGSTVSNVEPKVASLGGETRLTIYGTEFSKDQYSQNDDENKGNKVYLVSESGQEVSCTIHKDGCTDLQIMCYTPEGMSEEYHYIKVKVDGVTLPDGYLCSGNPTSSNCRIKPTSSNTPTVSLIRPQSGPPGTMVSINGTIFTERFGSNTPTSRNNNTQKLLRIFVGPSSCEMKNGDDFYGFALNEDDSDEGYIVCKTQGVSVGYYNATYIVETPYGRSVADDSQYRTSASDIIYLFQLYTDISSISVNQGSTAGGLKLTIYGSYFDDLPPYVAPEAYVDDTVCEITKVVRDQYVECVVAEDPQSSATKFAGNRGINLETWTVTKDSGTIDDILALTSSDSGYQMTVIDELFYEDATTSGYVSKFSTYFTPSHSGEYQFILRSDEGAKLFVDSVETVTSTRSDRWSWSARQTLVGGTKYLIEVISFDNTAPSLVELQAKFYQTQFNKVWTGRADDEIQVIGITSTVVDEVQQLTFESFSAGSSKSEVQKVVVESNDQFRLGLYGVYTEPLSTSSSDSAMTDALKALPVFDTEESVSVVRDTASSTPTYVVTFDSKRGDWPDISVLKVSGQVTSTVTTKTTGTPDNDNLFLSLEGVPSPSFTASSLDASSLEKVLTGMFEAHCPAAIESEATQKIYHNYEEYDETFWGTIVKDTEPFCGRSCLKNPRRIYRKKEKERGITVSQYKSLCFAYKGVLRDYIWMKYTYKDGTTSETEEVVNGFAQTFEKDAEDMSTTWYYTCFDMDAAITARRSDDSDFKVNEIWVAQELTEDIYVDALYIGHQDTTTDTAGMPIRRRPAAMPNGAIIDTVSVTGSANVYEVTLKPFECGNQFALLELGNGRLTAGRVSYPGTAATYQLSNGGSGKLKVSRTSNASPPVTGFIDITFNGNTKTGLNISLEAEQFDIELESLRGIGALSVEKDGDCANFNLQTTFLSLPGDLSEMTVDDSDLQGISPSASISTALDGGLYLNFMGDMSQTVETTPQVILYINDVRTECTGDCSFTWDSSVTPTVTDVSPTSGTLALGTTIVLTGTMFSSTNSDNTVTIGGVACDVTAATTTSITCSVGNGPVGEHKVVVNVADKGDAHHSSGDVMFTYTADITGISPTSGSLGGGVELTITGNGFKSDARVTINAKDCEVTSGTAAQITCMVPANTAGTYDVTVIQGTSTLTHSGFQYTSSLTATVSSVSPAAIGVAGDRLTISGTSFGSSEGSVTVGSQAVTVISWVDSEVVVDTGVIDAGTLDIKIQMSGGGYALDSSNEMPSLDVDLRITNVSPLKGSLQGGTYITITGSGFGTNDSLVEVTVGDTQCDIMSIVTSQLVCKIAPATQAHVVTNMANDPVYGLYYAFDQPQITIKRGESIRWKWYTADFVNDILVGIDEVATASSTDPIEGGFSSGSRSRNGEYEQQFSELGTYYYTSGFVDIYSIKKYFGQVDVVEADAVLGEVNVKVNGISAVQNVGGSSDPADSSSCKSVTSAKTGCSETTPSGGDSTKFNFIFSPCNTPKVSNIDVKDGTSKTAITITGEGMSTKDCQNEVTIGDSACTVTASTEQSITCTLDTASEPDLGTYLPVSLRVGNRGHALMTSMSVADKSFAVRPNIMDITPLSGSLAGGATLTITGFGLGDAAMAFVNGYACTTLTSSYTQITCESPSSSSEGEQEVTVNVMINGQPLAATCETTTMRCTYTYTNTKTATVTDITPTSMSGTTTFSITGTSLSDNTADLYVSIGGVTATITAATATTIDGTINAIPAGSNNVVVKLKDYGMATGSLVVTGTATISGVTPSSGSIHGNTEITISGAGFVGVNTTTVTLDGTDCSVSSVTLTQVVCTTSAHAAGTINVAVTSSSQTYPTSSTYEYSSGSTPTISSINPTEGLASQTLTITGSNLDGGATTILLDDVVCSETFNDGSMIKCTIDSHATGEVPVSVYVAGLGDSNTDVNFQYQLSLTDITPTTGGLGGGQTVTLTGAGMDDTSNITICGDKCTYVSSTSAELVCKTPIQAAGSCDVVASVNGLTVTLSSAYTYDSSLTPTVTGVSPTRGGTGGGTSITVTGTGFGTNSGDVVVTIAGSVCTITDITDTQLVCDTGSHSGSIEADVDVEVGGYGVAELDVSADQYHYIDVWSSTYTWGGGPLPAKGEFIVIPAGMTLLLDTDTPVLDFLLIQGGKVIFDDKDVELQSKYILITDGGALQVGTEAEPFQHKAIITLHGHMKSKELPIYGTKVLGVRNGTLDLHGIPSVRTWTTLSATASAGSSTLQLEQEVDWNVGDEIIVATTGHHESQGENEKKTIASISGDGLTITLDSALEADHSGVEETFDGTLVQFRGEVGLLTHNVVVRGNSDAAWEGEIKACPDGFDTGEFATQTCFQGRFGDEIGSSQFGAIILVHSPVRDSHEAVARISYTEVTFAGQAFRLGRYPIHFHLNGDMSTSYVRGCGIHHTFNRAVNIHGTHNTLIEHTVIYNIMGGAFFLEDGIETGNTLQYNLAVFVRSSSSLLNDDITPASFWVTNPNNTIQHNHAAGGTHFGFWYRMLVHPDGPSFTPDVCCQNVPLGVFQNNTAHSFGWFGLWIFDNYFPMKDGCGHTEVEPAIFQSLTAWNNEKGCEAVNVAAVQFHNFIMVQNQKAGAEWKLIMDDPSLMATDGTTMLVDSLVVGTTTVMPDSDQGCTRGGVIFPYGSGFRLKNVRFVNFASSECSAFRWTRIDGTCTIYCGGYNYYTEGLSFTNAPNKARFDWEWEGIIVDKDGSATGKGEANWNIVPDTENVPTDCEDAPEYSKNLPAKMCPPTYKWHRFSLNEPLPESLEGKYIKSTNRFGTSLVTAAKKRITHPNGWAFAVLDKETYTFEWQYAEQVTNISYKGMLYEFEPEDYIIMTLDVKELPDRLSIDGGNTFINGSVTLDPNSNVNGDWAWDNTNKQVKMLVHGTKRTKRGAGMPTNGIDRPQSFTAFKCFYDNCIPPPDQDTIPPGDRPLDYDVWDDNMLWWNDTEDGYITNDPDRNSSYGVPQELDNVKILYDNWVVMNASSTKVVKLGTLHLEGVLELMNTQGAEYELNCDFIIIKGGRLVVGLPEEPFEAMATIILRGSIDTPAYPKMDSPLVGAKAIAVFGGLDLHGKVETVPWTRLAATVSAGATQIILADQVDWSVNDDIVIGPTSYDVWETETRRITAVASDKVTLTLNSSLAYKHIAHSEDINGKTLLLAAPVGRLTRNIRIVGEDYDNLYKDNFGARILVGLLSTADQTYTGYARLSNTEFQHTGQEGFTEEYDPRFSVAWVATGTVSDVKPSYVKDCTFHKSFNTAVGAFGVRRLNITGNVVHGAIGNALRSSADETRFEKNLVTLVQWTGSYQERREPYNFRWEAGIEALKGDDLILRDNVVAGSERFGYHVKPLECGDTSGRYSNNIAQSGYIGVGVLPADQLGVSCAMYQGISSVKNNDFGFFYENGIECQFDDVIAAENTVGIWIQILGPDCVSHQRSDKEGVITNSLIVGHTASFDCNGDVHPTSNANYQLSSLGRAVTANGGIIGVTVPQFLIAGNSAPEKPFNGIMAYNSLTGLSRIEDTTFAHFTSSCPAYAIATSPKNDDGNHPLWTKGITLEDVDEGNTYFNHRPNVGKINSADCVDMDCDGLKKTLLKDMDGSLLGTAGVAFSQSEWEWNGDRRRGLGDERIPKEMVTQADGTKIPYRTLAPNLGIYRTDDCVYKSDWQAYMCPNPNYELLMIESMDPDTETRRLSPVALLGGGYLDLINGPQDHGWCSGYTCRKRVSAFMALVAADVDYLLHFSSTTPFDLRYYLQHAAADTGIKLTVWYSRPNRLDVYVDGVFVMPTNCRMLNGNYIVDKPEAKHTPAVANATGTNLIDRDSGYISFIVKGPSIIDIKTIEVIIVSFSLPAMTEEAFFGDNMVENLAAFLNIPLSKVRIASVVSASSNRRRRSTEGIVVQVEIGDEPVTNINDTQSDTLTYDSLITIASSVVDECQAGNISDTLSIAGGCESVEVPSEGADAEIVTYSTPSPVRLVFTKAPVPEYEGVPLRTQPKVQAVNVNGIAVTELGTAEYPWQLTVSIRAGTGHPSAVLEGNLTVTAANGWFNFTNLAITHMGTDYILDFNVTYPSVAENFTLASDPMTVDGRPIKAGVRGMTSGDIVSGSSFTVTIDLLDANTNDIISDIAWRSHTWQVTATLLGDTKYANASGVLTSTFNPSSGQALLPDISISGIGMYYLQYRVVSTPNDFDLKLNHKIRVIDSSKVGMVAEENYEIQIKFDVDFNKVLSDEDKQAEFEGNMMTQYANMWPDVVIQSSSLAEGSIIVTFVIEGTTSDVNSTAYSLCDSIYNNTAYEYNGYTLTLTNYMTINNSTFYGVSCGAIDTEDDEDDDLHWAAILGIVLGCILVLAVVVVVVWIVFIKPKNKTHNMNKEAALYIGKDNKAVEDILFSEGTFTSMKFNGNTQQAPVGTSMARAYENHLTEKRPLSGLSVNPTSPTGAPINVAKLTQQRPITPVSPALLTPNGAAVYNSNLRPSSPPMAGTPMLHRANSAQSENLSESPLPPVGDDLYRSGYITSPEPANNVPHLPAPTKHLKKFAF